VLITVSYDVVNHIVPIRAQPCKRQYLGSVRNRADAESQCSTTNLCDYWCCKTKKSGSYCRTEVSPFIKDLMFIVKRFIC